MTDSDEVKLPTEFVETEFENKSHTRPPVVTDEVERLHEALEAIKEHLDNDENLLAWQTANEMLASMPAVVSGGRPPPCPTCEGRGVYDSHPIPPDKGPAMEFECYTCNGTGNAPAQPGIKP